MPDSSASTPSRFTSQSQSAEDHLKSQTVGLVHLDDFRKRRAEALEIESRSGTATPIGGERSGSDSNAPNAKRKKKTKSKGKLSFAVDDEDGDDAESNDTPRDSGTDGDAPTSIKKKLGANKGVGVAPKAMTKAATLREQQTRDQLRKEFLAMQEIVKETEIMIPFVFWDGGNIPGGACRVKKGEHVWLFLDKARKVGAELGVGGGEKGDRSRKEWARVGVDDLMMVRGNMIIPHHYDFYYFVLNKSVGFNGRLFKFSAEPTSTSPSAVRTEAQPEAAEATMTFGGRKKEAVVPLFSDSELEGANDDPTLTKVVDRRWFEKNKHIYPMSTWEEFDPEKDYSEGIRRDASGNAFFFS